MGTFVTLLIFGMIWGLAYFAAPLIVWTAVAMIFLVVMQYLGIVVWSALLLWPIFLALVLPFLIPSIRIPFFTQRLFLFFRKVLPTMSDTEREAIEAGNVWWEAKLFQGRMRWREWLYFERPSLTDEEKHFLEHSVNQLLSMLNDWHILQEAHDLPPEVWDFLKKEKFFGMIIPKRYGGLGFSALAHSSIITKIATQSISTAVTTMVPNSLGPAELLLKYGTEKQKDYYLPRLATGEDIPCFALTSYYAGSDAGSIQDKGIVCKGSFGGKEILGIQLNWDKRYITLAPVATVLGLAFKLYDPDGLLGDKKNLGITLCLIPTNTSGVEIGKRHFPLGMAFMNGPTRGRNVFIPIDWIIGGREMAGHGWRMLMECLAAGRAISLPALSTATALIGFCVTGAYASLREQFRIPIGYFEGIQAALARIGALTYIMEATRQITASSLDLGERPGVASAIAKYHMTEMGRQITLDSMDVHGGKTIMLGPNNYLGKVYQAQPISITVEGANILTRSLMIFGQGAIRCHPFVRDEMEAAKLASTNEDAALKAFDDAIWPHVRYVIANLARSIFLGLTGAWFKLPPKWDSMARYFQKLSWHSNALAFVADVAMMKLGGKLKKAENLSARLGDVLSYLYLSSCVLKYYYESGENEQDKAYVYWALEYNLHQSQLAFSAFLENFPSRPMAWLLRIILFPFGAHCRAPKDDLSEQIALNIMQDTPLRDRLAQSIYMPSEPQDGFSRVEAAFKKLVLVNPLLTRIEQAVRDRIIDKELAFSERIEVALEKDLIEKAEYDTLLEFDKLRFQALSVDEFSANYFAERVNKWKSHNIHLKAERFS